MPTKTSQVFNVWAALSNFYFTSSGPVTGALWSVGNGSGGGYPTWANDETNAWTYVTGQPAAYSN